MGRGTWSPGWGTARRPMRGPAGPAGALDAAGGGAGLSVIGEVKRRSPSRGGCWPRGSTRCAGPGIYEEAGFGRYRLCQSGRCSSRTRPNAPDGWPTLSVGDGLPICELSEERVRREAPPGSPLRFSDDGCGRPTAPALLPFPVLDGGVDPLAVVADAADGPVRAHPVVVARLRVGVDRHAGAGGRAVGEEVDV